MRILIKNGTILTAENEFKGDLLTEGEKIKAIGDLSGMEADQVIDAEGKIIVKTVGESAPIDEKLKEVFGN